MAMPVDTHAIRILSQRLNIEPFCEQDAVESFACITPALTRYMSWEPPASLEEYAQVWGRWLPAIADGNDIVFTIRERVNARFTGLVGLHHTGSGTPELGIWIREDKHGLGLVVKRCGRLFSGLASGWWQNTLSTLLRRRIVRVDVLLKLWGESSSKGGRRKNMIRLCIRYRGFSYGHWVCDYWPARTAEIGQ